MLLNVARAAGGAGRSRRAPRPGRRGCQVGARRRAPERLRARGAARFLARRRDRGLLARRRHRLALTQVRPAGQRGHRVRARPGRRPARAHGRRPSPGPVLGVARRRRELRRGDRDRVRGPARRPALRRRVVLRSRALGRDAGRVDRAAPAPARGADVVGVDHPLPADPGRTGVRPWSLTRGDHGRAPRQRGRRPRPARPVARARPGPRHVRDGPADRALRPRHGPARPAPVPALARARGRAPGGRDGGGERRR